VVNRCAIHHDRFLFDKGVEALVVTINERTSRYLLIAHVPFKTAELVSQAVIAVLKPYSMCVHTLTTDNGREFAQYERIAATLDADFFFAHPYSSWERGANENMNGLIRQFFPKKMPFNLITKKDIEMAMHRLNHRPRKCLGYRTSHEVFMEQFQLHNQSVALQT
jgi:transposase, IS30 family